MLRLPSLLGSQTLVRFNYVTSTLGQPLIVCAVHQSRVIATSKVAANGVVKESYFRWKRCSYTSASLIRSHGTRPCLPHITIH